MNPGLDWEGARNRDARRGAGVRRWTPATNAPPSEAQKDLIRRLAADLGVRPHIPRTRRKASAEIDALLVRKRKQP